MRFVKHRFLVIALSITTFIGSGAQGLQQHSVHTANGQEFSAVMEASMQAMHQGMHAVAAVPGAEDEVFVRMMIPHHQGAVEMARAILRHGRDKEIQRLAKAIVAEQQYEIQLMQLWLARMDSRTLQASKGVTR